MLQTVNNYKKEVFNGDIGSIAKIEPVEQEVTVDFDNRTVVYDFEELDELGLAYAMTIHKSQGSEYPAVILPVHTQHYIMLQRNLLYTGITRGRKLVVLVGTTKALAGRWSSRYQPALHGVETPLAGGGSIGRGEVVKGAVRGLARPDFRQCPRGEGRCVWTKVHTPFVPPHSRRFFQFRFVSRSVDFSPHVFRWLDADSAPGINVFGKLITCLAADKPAEASEGVRSMVRFTSAHVSLVLASVLFALLSVPMFSWSRADDNSVAKTTVQDLQTAFKKERAEAEKPDAKRKFSPELFKLADDFAAEAQLAWHLEG